MKSRGHVVFVPSPFGEYELFVGPDGDLFRAPASNPLDVRTGFRLGGRFEARPSGAAFAIASHLSAADGSGVPAWKMPEAERLLAELG